MTCQGISCYRADIAYELLSNLGFVQWLVLSKHEGGSWTLVTQMGLTLMHWPTTSQWACTSHKLINMSRFRISADFHDPSCMSPLSVTVWNQLFHRFFMLFQMEYVARANHRWYSLNSHVQDGRHETIPKKKYVNVIITDKQNICFCWKVQQN